MSTLTPAEIEALYRDRIYRVQGYFIKHRMLRADAFDLAHDVFERLLKYPPQQHPDDIIGYVFVMAQHVLIDWKQKQKRRMRKWERVRDAESEECSPDATDCIDDVSGFVREKLELLTPRQQRLLKLRLDQQLEYQQIAEAEGVTKRIVLRDLTKAYSTLRGELRELDPKQS